jgi:hypothetical protein
MTTLGDRLRALQEVANQKSVAAERKHTEDVLSWFSEFFKDEKVLETLNSAAGSGASGTPFDLNDYHERKLGKEAYAAYHIGWFDGWLKKMENKKLLQAQFGILACLAREYSVGDEQSKYTLYVVWTVPQESV